MAPELRVVEARDLGRRFGATPALRGVSLDVTAGEQVAIFGPNGAGKTTLLRILATLLAPSSGTLRVLGLDPRRQAGELRRRIGVVGHRTYLDDDLTAAENLAFYARLYGVLRPEARATEALELVGLAHRRGDLVRTLSRGMQQRVALARALLHDPELLLLDEPDTGLDAAGVDALAAAVARPGRVRTVVMTSHHPDRAARLASRALLLQGGRLVADGATREVGARVGAPAAVGAEALAR